MYICIQIGTLAPIPIHRYVYIEIYITPAHDPEQILMILWLVVELFITFKQQATASNGKQQQATASNSKQASSMFTMPVRYVHLGRD